MQFPLGMLPRRSENTDLPFFFFQGFSNCTCISFVSDLEPRVPLGQPILIWIALDFLGDLISPWTSAGKLLFSREGVDYNHPCLAPSSFPNWTENSMSTQVDITRPSRPSLNSNGHFSESLGGSRSP